MADWNPVDHPRDHEGKFADIPDFDVASFVERLIEHDGLWYERPEDVGEQGLAHDPDELPDLQDQQQDLHRQIVEIKKEIQAGDLEEAALQETADELAEVEKEIAILDAIKLRAKAKRSVDMSLLLKRATDPKKPYGDVSYADPGYQADGKKRYPLDSEEHCRAAWSYVNMPKNAAKYTPGQLAKIKARIKSAGQKYGIEFGDRSRHLPAVCLRAFDFRFDSRSSDGRTLEGYAAVFGTSARIADLQGDFDEVIVRGAFTRSLSQRTPVLQFEHGRDPRVGAVPIGAIDDLDEDEQGLHVRATLFDNPVVEPVRQAIAGRAIKGMSFRFSVPDGGDKWARNGKYDRREVRDADVFELGPVVFPAYDATTVGVRSLLAHLDPEERRALVRELAAEVRLAVDLEDLTGRPDAWSAGGGDFGTRPGAGAVPAVSTSSRFAADDESLRLRGIK